MESIKKLLFLSLSLFAFSSSAVFFKGERFINRQGNIIECFGDCHVYCNEDWIASLQQQEILDRALDCNAHVIVEDMVAQYSLLDKKIVRLIDTELFESPLDNLSTRCKDSCISCINVEFRQKSCASLAGLPIPASQILEPFEQVVAEIDQYNDCSFLNAYYWKTVSRVCQGNKSLLSSMQNTDCCLYDYCAGMHKQAKDAINLFDAPFIDARIVHSVYENRFNPKIFICAGANHIERIRPLLLKLGYKAQGAIGQDLRMQKNKQNLLTVDSSCALSVDDYFNHYDTQNPYITNNSISLKLL